MARPRVPVITDPAPFVIIAEIMCTKQRSDAQVRLYQRKLVGRPRNVTLHVGHSGRGCATVEEASEQLLVALAHYVRLLGPKR